MNKRARELHDMATNAGLTILSHGLGTKGRPSIRVRAGNGEETVFQISQHQGDLRGDKNELARIRRWAKENTPEPVAAPPAVAVVKTPPTRFAPSATFIPAKVVAKAPAPAPTQSSLQLQLAPMNPSSTTTSKPAANEPRNNRLSADETIDLNDWVRNNDATQYSTQAEMAAAAKKALGFEVTIANLAHPLRRNKITHFERKAHATTEGAYELAFATGLAMTALAENLGFKMPSEAVAVFERHGIFVPGNARKAA